MCKYSFLSLLLLVSACNNGSSQAEKEYIKNLEEKNEILEKELQEAKGTPPAKEIDKSGYFTIGSTEDEVLAVMGEPTSYLITADEARKFLYGMSTVYLFQGKVISYDNLEGNLKVRVQ